MTPLIPIGAAAIAAYLLFGKKLMPAPRVLPVPPIVPLAPGQFPNYGVNGAAATAALNLANYLHTKGCDSGMTDLVTTFQQMHNQDPAGNGPSSALRDLTGALPTTGQFDAKTAFALGGYTNYTIDPFFAPCDSASQNLLGGLNHAAQALYVRLTTGGCPAGPSSEVHDFQAAWNAVGLPALANDGLYGKNSAVAMSTTIASMLDPSTMTAPAACV